MDSQIKKLNKQLETIKKDLIKQLQHNNIEYINLHAYASRVNNLKHKKDLIYMDLNNP